MKNKLPIKKKKLTRQKRLYVTIGAFAVIIAAIAVIIMRNNANNAANAANGAKIFYYDSQQNVLKPEIRPTTAVTDADRVKFVLEELSLGPKNTSVFSPSVPGSVISSAAISGSNVDVTMTNDYYTLQSNEEIICRSAIVYSLTDLPFVDSVTINIEGNGLLKPNGQPFGKIRAQDIVMTPVINPQGQSKTITLYFADAEQTGLVAETRTIAINPNEAVVKYIVNELIKGPADDRLAPTVPPETRLLEINVLEGVCSVDLSKEFINKHTGGPNSELLTIYSIVNSLCEQSDIKNVQFLIEGKRQESFKNQTGFNNLYEAKEFPSVDTP